MYIRIYQIFLTWIPWNFITFWTFLLTISLRRNSIYYRRHQKSFQVKSLHFHLSFQKNCKSPGSNFIVFDVGIFSKFSLIFSFIFWTLLFISVALVSIWTTCINLFPPSFQPIRVQRFPDLGPEVASLSLECKKYPSAYGYGMNCYIKPRRQPRGFLKHFTLKYIWAVSQRNV